MKLLITEDDPTSRTLLDATLRKWGHEVVTASDGNEAWAILQADDAPGLAILDWMMPGLDGPELCRRARTHQRADERYIYLILLTSKASKEDIVAGMEVGADDYVVKPFDHHELRVRVRAGQRISQLQSELVAAKRALVVQATHDALTGLLNRGAVLERLAEELARGRRERKPVTVGMLDLDHFKDVNDTYGHKVGDLVLCACAEGMRNALRQYDVVGRYGGEEFLIVLPGLDGVATKGVLERIRRSVAVTETEVPDDALHVTASLGAAVAMEGGAADEIIQQADRALYEAKACGRNCVRYATDAPADEARKEI